METAPRDGTRILVKHNVIHCISYGNWGKVGEKWQECRWVEEGGGSPANFEPWCGTERTHISKIEIKDCIGWVELPEVWE